MEPEDSDLHSLLTQNGVGYYGFPGDNRQLSSAYNYSSSMMLMMLQQQQQQQSSFPLVHLTSASGVLTDETTPEERALAALKNHKEAEKRRRERISSHLNKLRTILPSNSKLDKASLLAKVVERVKELKQQALELSESESFPSETDEVTVLAMASSNFNGDDMTDDVYSDGNGGGMGRRLIFKASLCCDDRSDLLPDIIEILKSLHLEMVKAEMVTLGGRIRNILIVAAEEDHTVESVHSLQNALKSLLERSNSNSIGNDRSKRRRVLLDHLPRHHDRHNLIIQ